jgi:hypothetical protein
MAAKVSYVRLTAGERTEVFEMEHAENLMALPNTRWRVADDEKVEWTENGFRPKKNREGASSVKQA